MKDNIYFHKERNLKKCILDTWLIFAAHPTRFIKFLSPAILVCSVSLAIFIWAIGNLCNSLIPLQIFHSQGKIPYKDLLQIMGPSIFEYGWALLALLNMFVGYVIFQNACFTQISYAIKNKQIPSQNIFDLSFLFYRKFLRCLKYFSIQFLFLFLGVSLIILCVFLLSKWMWLLLLPSLIYWGVACEVGSLNYILTKESLHTIIMRCFHPKEVFGNSFVILFITSIFILILIIIGLFPNLLIQLSYYYDTLGVLAYDSSGMPPYIPILSFLCAVVGSSLFLIGLTIQKLALTFVWCSTQIDKIKKEA